jgi:hypothetical protein
MTICVADYTSWGVPNVNQEFMSPYAYIKTRAARNPTAEYRARFQCGTLAV